MAALNFPQLKACKGVEFLANLAETAKEMGRSLRIKCEEKNIPCAPVQIETGDMLEVDWFDADIVYFSSVCYPEFLIDGVLDRFVNLKKGSRIISLKPLPMRPYMEIKASLKVRMSWGLHQVTYYRIV